MYKSNILYSLDQYDSFLEGYIEQRRIHLPLPPSSYPCIIVIDFQYRDKGWYIYQEEICFIEFPVKDILYFYPGIENKCEF